MKTIIIICEGETEKDFCKHVLSSFFRRNNIIIKSSIIERSNGGIVSWYHLKKQIEFTLKRNPAAVVTTFIDYYGILSKHEFPLWSQSYELVDKGERMHFLEDAMKEAIHDDLRFRFIPYLQLHEFEGLLFNDTEIFRSQLSGSELDHIDKLEHIINQYPNPELINDHKDTAPSKRLESLINGYRKTIHGPILAEAIGLQKIRAKCPRFDAWVTKLENI